MTQVIEILWSDGLCGGVRARTHRRWLGLEAPNQVRPAPRVALARLDREDQGGPEEAECLAKFAPACYNAGVVHEAEQNRPDDTLRKAVVLVDIGNGQSLLCADRGPEQSERHRVLRELEPVGAGDRLRCIRSSLHLSG